MMWWVALGTTPFHELRCTQATQSDTAQLSCVEALGRGKRLPPTNVTRVWEVLWLP